MISNLIKPNLKMNPNNDKEVFDINNDQYISSVLQGKENLMEFHYN